LETGELKPELGESVLKLLVCLCQHTFPRSSVLAKEMEYPADLGIEMVRLNHRNPLFRQS
jgi:hypothetical protein